MSNRLFTFTNYVKYRLRAKGAHGLHSPFLYGLYRFVFKKRDQELAQKITRIRNHFLSDTSEIVFVDPKTTEIKKSTIRKLAAQVSSRQKFSLFLIRLINYLKVYRVMETGTSLGINALALAYSNASEIITIEGSKEIAVRAQKNIDQHDPNGKIRLIQGHITEVFEELIQEYQPELVFLDADHRSETIFFYLNALKKYGKEIKCVVIHDIYWSADMLNAWKSIIRDTAYHLTVDIFEAGLIFPDYPMEKQHITIKF